MTDLKPSDCVDELLLRDVNNLPWAKIVYKASDYHLDFFILSVCESIRPDGRLEAVFTGGGFGDGVSPDEARQIAHGYLKWDGCLNFFVGEDGVYAHACGLEGLRETLSALETVFTLGPKIPNWDR